MKTLVEIAKDFNKGILNIKEIEDVEIYEPNIVDESDDIVWSIGNDNAWMDVIDACVDTEEMTEETYIEFVNFVEDIKKEQKFKQLKQKGYDKCGSWGLWKKLTPWKEPWTYKDCSIEGFEDDLRVRLLNTDVMIIGYNWASRGNQPIPWYSFHGNDYPRGNDQKLAALIMNSKAQGAYMTDLLKFWSETDSAKVNPTKEELQQHAVYLQEEIDILKPKYIITLGTKTEQKLKQMQKLGYIETNAKIIPIGHYSKQGVSQKVYVEKYLPILEMEIK